MNDSSKYKNFGSGNGNLTQILDLCNQGQFDKALSLLDDFLKDSPDSSEGWRLMAQVHWMHLHDADKAIEELKRALELEPKNLWALILMGNVLIGGKNDTKSAKHYYDTALEYYPDNAIAINNIGATYMKNGDYEGALPLMEKALALDRSYMNSYYGLALCYYNLGKLKEAFKICHEGALKSQDRPENPQVREELIKLYVSVAGKLSKSLDHKKQWQSIKEQLEAIDHRPIRIVEDKSLKIYAKMEYAPLHGTKENVIRYNPDKPYVDHLFVHEMMHLKMLQQNTQAGVGKMVMSSEKTRTAFQKRYQLYMQNKNKRLNAAQLKEFLLQVADGFGLQLMNCPLDLFVEEMIYRDYEALRPTQMISLFQMERDNIESVKKASESNIFPPEILRINRILNLITSLHFKELYGINLIGQYRPSQRELEKANYLYNEFKITIDAYDPGDEYDLLAEFLQELEMGDLLEIADEREVAPQMKADMSLVGDLKELEKQALSKDEVDAANAEFAQKHKDGEVNPETQKMAQFMVEAMEYFDTQTPRDVHRIALEIAMVGVTGIHPEKSYTIKSLPNKTFGGYELLAYYYVSWARAIPEMLSKLGLPFSTAYDIALRMYNVKKGNL